MRGSNKSKRISWAADIHLCQETKRKATATSNMGGPSHSGSFWRILLMDAEVKEKVKEVLGWQSINTNVTFQGVAVYINFMRSLLFDIGMESWKVRLFLSEESPSQVGLNAQDHLQAKTSLLLHPGGAASDDLLPPGFEGTHPSSQLQVKLSQIPVIGWTNPPKMVLNLTWQVVAGEESKEIEYEDQRELRVLEAIYPRPSSIPPNPAVSLDVEDSQCIEGQIPSIPITPIEEEDAAADTSFDVPINTHPHLLATAMPTDPISPGSVPIAHGAESDIAAASAALTNIMKSNEHGNLIDPDLLTKILSTPEMIERLVRDYGNFDNSKHVPDGSSTQVAFSHPSITVNQAETSMPSSAAFTACSPSYSQPTGDQVGPVWRPPPTGNPPSLSSSMGAPPAKDVSYYKSLIQQHGGERQETSSYLGNRHNQQPVANQETIHNSKTKESRPKIMKPCIYFNSSRGCRNGANCAYQHDSTFQPRGSSMPAMQSSKRMKMDSEISS